MQLGNSHSFLATMQKESFHPSKDTQQLIVPCTTSERQTNPDQGEFTYKVAYSPQLLALFSQEGVHIFLSSVKANVVEKGCVAARDTR